MGKILKNGRKKVAIGLSGGVDSAFSAYLLKKQGYDVTAVYLDCFRGSGFPCQADIDRAMAVKVAHFLHIPLKIIDLRSQYRRSVIYYFFSEYKAGRTPNPDVVCNREIKFGIFYDLVINKWKFDYVATGHYARLVDQSLVSGRWSNRKKIKYSDALKTKDQSLKTKSLGMAKDLSKDQSYFLYLLKKEQLEHILFPIGDLTKNEVRAGAKKVKLPNWDKPDSQGICFIGKINVRKFLLTKIKPKKGQIIDLSGNVIGEHEGVWFYTIGQRHGFKLTPGVFHRSHSGSAGDQKPLYIMSKNIERNELIVAPKKHLYKRKFMIEQWHSLVSSETVKALTKKQLKVRVRHLGELYNCNLRLMTKDHSLINQTSSRASYEVVLKKPIFAVAPGQSAVFYNGEIAVGGGIIV